MFKAGKHILAERAGRYERTSAGYRAFVPNSLPPQPAIHLDGDLQVLLSKADRAIGRLDGSVRTLPNPDLFVFMYIRREAVLSSQIEGTQSSLQDLLAAEANMLGAGGGARDVDEVVNYVAAMNYGLERLNTLPVSTRLIREIHERLLDGVRGSHLTRGELRTTQNWIGPTGCSIDEAVFVPPPPGEIRRLLGDLESFLHNDDNLPLLLKIGLAHAHFETIHPFLDGNGRTGRLLIAFLLCEREVLHKPVLYLSHYFKRRRAEYYERLQAVRDEGDWEGWLAFFLQGVAEVGDEATETARRILTLREQHREAITEQFGRVTGNGYRVLELLFKRPIVSVSEVQETIGTSFQAANQLVRKMVRIGVLEQLNRGSRNRRFRYSAYVRLFSDEPLTMLD